MITYDGLVMPLWPHLNKPQADSWDMDEIINRWHMLYKGNVLSQRYLTGRQLMEGKKGTIDAIELSPRIALRSIRATQHRIENKTDVGL